MTFIRTRSGRYINSNHVIALSVEESKIELDGRRALVYKIVAYLPQPLLPAVLAIYRDEAKAQQALEELVKLLTEGRDVVFVDTEV